MLLHLLNRSPASSGVAHDVLRAMGPDDRLLLIESGVYGAVGPQATLFSALHGRCFALADDLASRGLSECCADWITVLDMQGFVMLTEETQRTVSWF
ncbi:sulfurtransferase complex subunit TusB [Halomonas sp. HP20-15]|uniref:sulfurtransferase complex subunit TusB n=1 Tax=Halomonas sp. HP20-15 TaxID=3085901 RepID=UPI002981EC70|nr:sulfurtransferase complex subunit TusB [Halomonas sp. HP20-15]MDW5375486.1 sulfurtransferase complex subunit TusB [Halomonas sp. HP20-15]